MKSFRCLSALVSFITASSLVYGFCPLALPKLSASTTRSLNGFASTRHDITLVNANDDTISKKKKVSYHYVLPLEQVSLRDLPRVGGKTASLGEMMQQLAPLGVDVPGGFAVTADAYDALLDRFRLRERLELLLQGIDGT